MKDWIVGVVIGLIVMLLCTVKVFAANNPEEAEREKALMYLSENAVVIPEEVEFWCEFYGERYDICPEILEAVCWKESRCTPDAQNASKTCKGLMQIKPACHQARMARCDVQNIFGIRENIKVGADYLSELKGTEDIAVALAIYNGQSDSQVEKVRQGKYTGYVAKVLEVSAALERAHGK